MKKTYICPDVGITDLNLVQMFASSVEMHETGADDNIVLAGEDKAWNIWEEPSDEEDEETTEDDYYYYY